MKKKKIKITLYGLNKKEQKFWHSFLKKTLKEITQDELDRFHKLDRKFLDAWEKEIEKNKTK